MGEPIMTTISLMRNSYVVFWSKLKIIDSDYDSEAVVLTTSFDLLFLESLT